MPSSAAVAEPAEAPTGLAGPRGEALHRALVDASQRGDRELAQRLGRTDEHALPAPPAARPD